MEPITVFVAASSVVLAALVLSLVAWARIAAAIAAAPSPSCSARVASRLFVACFALYAVGQGLAIAQVLGHLRGLGDVSSYCYAAAAILFAVGSWAQLRSVRGR